MPAKRRRGRPKKSTSASPATVRKVIETARAKREPEQPSDDRHPSQHPEAVRARERRQQQRAAHPPRKAPAPAPARPAERAGAVLTPEVLRAAEAAPDATPAPPPAPTTEAQPPALTGAIHPPARTLDTQARDWQGLIAVIGLILAQFRGDHWRVTEEDAREAGRLCAEAWPDVQMGNAKQLLAVGALGGMLGERVRKDRELRGRRQTPTVPETTERPAPRSPAEPKPDPVASGWSN